MACELGEPTVVFPKLALEGVTVKAGCTPLPLKDTTAVAPCEVVTVRFPVTFSEAEGVKVTLRVRLWPADKVRGVVMPVAEKSLAFTAT